MKSLSPKLNFFVVYLVGTETKHFSVVVHHGGSFMCTGKNRYYSGGGSAWYD